MAVLTTGDVWTLTTACTLGAQSGLNILHFKIGTTVLGGVGDVFAAAFLDNLLGPLYKALISTSASWYGVKLVRKFPVPTDIAVVASNIPGFGTAGAAFLPSQTSGLISWTTAMAGRKGRGRTYVPFPAVADITNAGQPTAGYVTRLTALATALNNVITIPNGPASANLLLSITGKLPTAPAFPTQFFGANNRWATHRSRGDYGRPNGSPPINP